MRTIVAVLLHCLVVTAFAQSLDQSAGSVALVGGKIYVDPMAAPIRNGTVLIQKGVITAVGEKGEVQLPANVTVIDCTGSAVSAGFWNSHVHFHERKWFDAGAIPADELQQQLEAMLLQFGFTSVFDTWSNFANTRALRRRIEAGEIFGPRIRTAGEALMPKGGVPVQAVTSGFGPVQIVEVSDSAEARAAAIKLLDAHADGIKLYAMTYPSFRLSEELMAAVVSEAHARGKPVFAHPTLGVALQNAVRAGVDVIVHTTPLSGAWDASTLALMKEKNVALVPTLKLWHYETRNERVSRQQRLVAGSIAQLKAWIDADGTVLFGTDVGYMDRYETADEFHYMSQAGMDHRAILASLTTAPAQRFGEGKRLGRIANGFLGDIVVMQGDPEVDVAAFASVRYTIRDGNVIFSADKAHRY